MATYVDLATLFTPAPGAIVPATWAAQIREDLEWFQTNRRVICTSATRPTGFEGLAIYETDTDKMYVHNGSSYIETGGIGAYSTTTPTWTQTATITKTTTYSSYFKFGRFVSWQFDLSATSAGTGGANILLTLPVTASASNSVQGSFVFQDTGTTNYAGGILPSSTTAINFQPAGGTTHLGALVTIASGDRLYGTVNYQAAA